MDKGIDSIPRIANRDYNSWKHGLYMNFIDFHYYTSSGVRSYQTQTLRSAVDGLRLERVPRPVI